MVDTTGLLNKFASVNSQRDIPKISKINKHVSYTVITFKILNFIHPGGQMKKMAHKMGLLNNFAFFKKGF
jgi:hypothetical protein